jgi:recombination protein RecA
MPEPLDTSLATNLDPRADFYGPGREQTDYQPRTPVTWSRKELAGRIAELSSLGAGAGLTMAFELVLEAQLEGEPVCWVTMLDSSFYPPDITRSGIDLASLPVVRVKNGSAAARAADKLIRSGAFGLVVVDLVEARDRAFVPTPLLSRLLGLAGKHDTALLFLTEKQNEAPSIGPLISLRARAGRARTAEGRFTCDIEILKDKRRGPGWTHCEVRHGPSGLR